MFYCYFYVSSDVITTLILFKRSQHFVITALESSSFSSKVCKYLSERIFSTTFSKESTAKPNISAVSDKCISLIAETSFISAYISSKESCPLSGDSYALSRSSFGVILPSSRAFLSLSVQYRSLQAVLHICDTEALHRSIFSIQALLSLSFCLYTFIKVLISCMEWEGSSNLQAVAL